MNLKYLAANEIAESLAKILGDEEFNTFYKSAALKIEAGKALDSYKSALSTVKDKPSLDKAWNDYVDAVAQEEGTLNEMTKLQAQKAKELGLPGYSSPADDMCAHDQEGCAEDCECPEECKCKCTDGMMVASNFAIKHMIKLADVLDSKGFEGLASLVDESIQKIAAKKKEVEKSKGKKKKVMKEDKEDKEEKEDGKKKQKAKKEEKDEDLEDKKMKKQDKKPFWKKKEAAIAGECCEKNCYEKGLEKCESDHEGSDELKDLSDEEIQDLLDKVLSGK